MVPLIAVDCASAPVARSSEPASAAAKRPKRMDFPPDFASWETGGRIPRAVEDVSDGPLGRSIFLTGQHALVEPLVLADDAVRAEQRRRAPPRRLAHLAPPRVV